MRLKQAITQGSKEISNETQKLQKLRKQYVKEQMWNGETRVHQ